MATITAQAIGETGLAVVFTAVNASDTLTNDGNSYLHVKNTNANDVTVVADATRTCSQGFDHNMTMTVAATTGTKVMGPFPLNRYSSAVVITYSTISGVTAGAVTLT